MDSILGEILEVNGVAVALVADGGGALVAHRGRAVYDRALCELLAAKLAKVADAVQLQQEEWESIVARFSDGRLLVRGLGAVGGTPHVLAVVADATLNASFATVAIRVAANKLRKRLSGGGDSSALLSATPRPAAASSSVQPQTPGAESSSLSGSGLSWSKGSSGVARVQAADPASATFLSRCARALAHHVGPIAKVYVEEAVRRVAGDQPFAMPHAPRLVDDLCGQVEDPDDRDDFRRAIQKR